MTLQISLSLQKLEQGNFFNNVIVPGICFWWKYRSYRFYFDDASGVVSFSNIILHSKPEINARENDYERKKCPQLGKENSHRALYEIFLFLFLKIVID